MLKPQRKISLARIRDKKYYRAAHQGSLDFTHPSMQRLLIEVSSASKIIDLGCGEGTRLALLKKHIKDPAEASFFGVDINEVAIRQAQMTYSDLNFIQADLTKLPFANNSFDLAYSAFVFEHLENPEKVIQEAVRVIKKDGKLLIVAPNFGSPNRHSPNSNENKIKKIINGFLFDLRLFFTKKFNKLNWTKVEPKSSDYTIDSDTVVEPYLNSLIKFGMSLGLQPFFYSSYWQMDRFSLYQSLFRLLSYFKIYPFYFWGPHLCVIFKK